MAEGKPKALFAFRMQVGSAMAGTLHVEGRKGESVFYAVPTWAWPDIHASGWATRSQELFQEYVGIEDGRLLALVGSLCVEEAVDDLLGSFMPGYGNLREDGEFTFSLKMRVLRAMRMIPSRFLTYCDLIRRIRNVFAHHLEYKQLSQLNVADRNKLAAYVREMCDLSRDESDVSGLYKELVHSCLSVLHLYSVQVVRARRLMETDEFLGRLGSIG